VRCKLEIFSPVFSVKCMNMSKCLVKAILYSSNAESCNECFHFWPFPRTLYFFCFQKNWCGKNTQFGNKKNSSIIMFYEGKRKVLYVQKNSTFGFLQHNWSTYFLNMLKIWLNNNFKINKQQFWPLSWIWRIKFCQ